MCSSMYWADPSATRRCEVEGAFWLGVRYAERHHRCKGMQLSAEFTAGRGLPSLQHAEVIGRQVRELRKAWQRVCVADPEAGR